VDRSVVREDRNAASNAGTRDALASHLRPPGGVEERPDSLAVAELVSRYVSCALSDAGDDAWSQYDRRQSREHR